MGAGGSGGTRDGALRGVPRLASTRLRDALGQALAEADFTEEGLKRLFSVRSLGALPDAPACVIGRTVAGDSPLEVLARLFLLELNVPAATAERALGSAVIQAFRAARMLEVHGEGACATVGLQPADAMWFAYDLAQRRRNGHADCVLELGPSSRWVAAMALRRPVESTLDLGSGSGYLACLAARHSARVVASDVNGRATAFSAFNAALNGLDNVECVAGDLYAPLAGRQFDHIICNAPFVIAPARELAYRDGAPEICRRIVREAPPHLREEGVLQMSCNWPIRRGSEWRGEIAAWFEGTGCDALILRSATMDPANYALLMMESAGRAEQEQAQEADRWLEFYRREQIEAIGSGIVTMRPATGRTPWFEILDMPPYDRAAGETIGHAMAAREFLARIGDPADLLAARPSLAPELEIVERHGPAADGWARTGVEMRLSRGLRFAARVDPLGAALAGFLDGRRTVREAAESLAAAMQIPAVGLLPELPELVRRLLKLAILRAPAGAGRTRTRPQGPGSLEPRAVQVGQ